MGVARCLLPTANPTPPLSAVPEYPKCYPGCFFLMRKRKRVNIYIYFFFFFFFFFIIITANTKIVSLSTTSTERKINNNVFTDPSLTANGILSECGTQTCHMDELTRDRFEDKVAQITFIMDYLRNIRSLLCFSKYRY